jgi:hypothetical protein
MNQQDIDFIEEHILEFEAVKLGYTRNIQFNVLDEFQRIYQRNLDSRFVLNAWCGACVFDMLKRLGAHYEGFKYIQNKQLVEQPIQQPTQLKRGRKPKQT